MPERICAEIRIGGQISRSLKMKERDETVLNCLISMINGAEVSHDWDEAVAQIPVNEQDEGDAELLQYLDESGCLRFRCTRTENGEFEALEEFLVAHDIPYDRWHERYADLDSESVSFRPGMNAPTLLFVDARGDEIIDGETVREAIEKLDSFIKNYGTADRAQDWEALTDAQRLLHDACPEIPEKLEKFEIVP